MGGREDDEPLFNSGSIVFAIVAERLKHFPLNSARCKKTYEKYFKKLSTDEKLPEGKSCPTSHLPVLQMYERLRTVLLSRMEFDVDEIFKVALI